MKRISSISNQIKNNTYSYTGKGSFENIVKKYSQEVIQWLEELIPLQLQMEKLDKLEDVNFQKRNYTRILTKLFPNEYKEFVSLNILVRDTQAIASFYEQTYDISTLYNTLIKNKYLKYPGKYDKYVEFDLFQKFIMTYKDDIIKSNKNENLQTKSFEDKPNDQKQEDDLITLDKEDTNQIKLLKEDDKKENNNKWTNLLLGKIK